MAKIFLGIFVILFAFYFPAESQIFIRPPVPITPPIPPIPFPQPTYKFINEPAVVQLSPAVNFQIGEQFINRIFNHYMSSPFTLGSGSYAIAVQFTNFTIDFEINSCQINFAINVTFTVAGIGINKVISFNKTVRADEIYWDVNTEMLYMVLDKYNELSNYLNSQYNNLPAFVKTLLVQYFNKFNFYQKKLVGQFETQLNTINNDQAMDDVPLFWTERKTLLSVGFEKDYAKFSISPFLEKEQPRIEVWERTNSGNGNVDVLVVSNYAGTVTFVNTSKPNSRSENTRYSRFVAEFTTPIRYANVTVENQYLQFGITNCLCLTSLSQSQWMLRYSYTKKIERTW